MTILSVVNFIEQCALFKYYLPVPIKWISDILKVKKMYRLNTKKNYDLHNNVCQAYLTVSYTDILLNSNEVDLL